jgi:2-(1,2-epoxy-1,2-dihydrophenyl)acetyl-CoA isomerase
MSLYQNMIDDGDAEDAPQRVRVQRRDDRAVVTLDEPGRLNVLSAPLVRQLRRALENLVSDNDIRAVVLTGADPGFSAGGDLQMMRTAVQHR